MRLSESAKRGQLLARPGYLSDKEKTLGTRGLALKSARRKSLLHIPQSYRPGRAAPLAVMLHGSGGNAQNGLDLLLDFADKSGMLLLAPSSSGTTWDVLSFGYGPDVTCLDEALAYVFANYAVDPIQVAIGGFSDGASYALALGMINGGLFSHIISFSPGFTPSSRVSTHRPLIYISHGKEDDVLPIDSCSRRIVPALKRAGYKVLYQEFAGGHSAPAFIRKQAVEWFLSKKGNL
jgi:phospholipase/carboxylesterase